MKVGLYMAGTMFTETLYREVPEARNWEQRDQNNHWVPYGLQTFRHYACPNEPAYREYLKRALKIGVQELHADEIAFSSDSKRMFASTGAEPVWDMAKIEPILFFLDMTMDSLDTSSAGLTG